MKFKVGDRVKWTGKPSIQMATDYNILSNKIWIIEELGYPNSSPYLPKNDAPLIGLKGLSYWIDSRCVRSVHILFERENAPGTLP